MDSTNRPATVTARRRLTDSVVELVVRLDTPSGGEDTWEPGAHIDLVLPSGTVRQYSICGGDAARGDIRVAVLDEPAGRGGSREVHEHLHPGTAVEVRGPRNHFRLHRADAYLFIAGGIGITPILAMIDQVSRTDTPWTLLYGGRTEHSMAYLDEVAACQDRSRVDPVVTIVPEDVDGRPDIRTAVARAGSGTDVYACGPEPLLTALEDLAAELLEPGQLHLERFGAASSSDQPTDDGGLDRFEVEISSTGDVLDVGPEDRLIDVVRTVAPQVPFSCEEGYCGSCETAVLDGIPCHRDQVLTDDERAENDTMMICVGRSLSTRLTLDL